MELKKFDDGSVFTERHVAFALAAGAVGAVVMYKVNEKISTWRTKRWMRKTGWPQASIDRM